MRWFQREIEAGETNIDVVWLTPSDIRSLDSLATELVPPRRFASLRPESLSFSVGIGRLGWELGDRAASLTRLLTARCRQRALVVLLDEAHDLDKDVANVLLNASQSVAVDAPILLVLAGTPGLQSHLNTVSATFWNRARQIGVGRLDADATSAALIRPLAAQSPAIAFEDAALAKVIAESQGYPYFVQLWGDALWNAATTPERLASTTRSSRPPSLHSIARERITTKTGATSWSNESCWAFQSVSRPLSAKVRH